MPETSPRPGPRTLGPALAGLFTRLGLPAPEEFAALETTLTVELARRGHRARLQSLRRGVLVLVAENPLSARQLDYDLDDVVATVRRAHPGLVVDRALVRVARR